MNDWSHGYDVSTGYTYGFCREMAPDWLDLAARVGGHAPPRIGGAPFRYLELGAGQGMGLCLLAAANPQGEFVGVDFLPGHAEHANGVIAAAGLTNIRFEQRDFIDLAATWPEDFGSFDYVSLHGVYNWVSPQVCDALVECLRRATRPGSLVYCGYNTQPGWLATMPFQHIAMALKETSGKGGSEVFADTIALFDRLRSGGANTFRILPGLAARIDSVRSKNPAYLIQEYLHRSWRALWHSEVARDLADAGLRHIGTATMAENLLPALLPPPLRDTVLEQSNPGLRQDVQDFVINQFFRRDLFCCQPGGASDQSAAITQTRLHLASPPTGDTLDIEAAFGNMTLQAPAFAQIVEALRAGPKTIAKLAALPDMQQQGMANTVQILMLLLHARVLAVGTEVPGDPAAAQRLNVLIDQRIAEGFPYDHRAAPELGSGIPTG